MSNNEQFMATYREKLIDSVRQHPDHYVWPISELDVVMERMEAAFVAGSFNKDSTAIRNTCRALGIKNTYQAIMAFLEGGQ